MEKEPQPTPTPKLSFEVAIIVAHDNYYGIGHENNLPWRCREDMQWFKQKTLGHVVVMGRNTFESMGSKPLKDRINIVVSKTLSLDTEGVLVARSPAEALSLFAEQWDENPNLTLFAIGGNAIYKAFKPLTNRVFLTHLDLHCLTDTKFPGLGLSDQEWELVSEDKRQLEVSITPGVNFYRGDDSTTTTATKETPKQLTTVSFREYTTK
jgi:dihydrofolate reductase